MDGLLLRGDTPVTVVPSGVGWNCRLSIFQKMSCCWAQLSRVRFVKTDQSMAKRQTWSDNTTPSSSRVWSFSLPSSLFLRPELDLLGLDPRGGLCV